MSLSRYALMIFALALAGCDREKITVQQVPKDAEQTAQSPMMAQPAASGMLANPHAGMDMGMGMGGAAQPKLGFTVPTGWKEKPLADIRVGSFDAPGKDGQSADVAITPLPTMPPETELANLNMWRSAVGLPPADKAESAPVAIGSAQGKLYEVTGETATGRILVAVFDRDGMSYYFKMKGPDAVVLEQKPAFLEFVKSVSFEAAPVTAAMPAPLLSVPAETASVVTPANSGGPLPAGWKEVPATQFLLAKYVIQGSGDAKAEVNVSRTGGGMLPNVIRWCGQLGLPPMSEEDFSKKAQSVDVAGAKATLVDLTGTDMKTGKPARLVGIIVPGASDSGFYKIMGDPQIVGQQKDAFTKFVQTAKFSNAN